MFHLQQKLHIFTYSRSVRRVDGSILAGILSSFIVLCLGRMEPSKKFITARHAGHGRYGLPFMWKTVERAMLSGVFT